MALLIGVLALVLAVFTFTWMGPELFHMPVWALWLRLPIQVAMLWLILWSTH